MPEDATSYLWSELSLQQTCADVQQPLMPWRRIAEADRCGGEAICVSWDALCLYMCCYSGDLPGVRQTVSVRRGLLFQHLRIGEVALRASDFARLGQRAGKPTEEVLEYLVAEEKAVLRRMAWRLDELVPTY